jgi:PKD repeat protein
MRKFFVFFFVFFTSILLIFIQPSISAEISAKGLSPSKIQNAVDKASEGDTVVLPSGTYNGFNSTIEVPNGVSLRGQGKDNTILIHTSGKKAMFIWNRSADSSSSRVSISGIKFKGIGNSSTTDDGIHLLNGMKDFRVFDCEFEGFGEEGMLVEGDARGVIYNCRFINCFTSGFGYGIEVIGNGKWDSSPPYGNKYAVYIEDCYFTGCKHAVASSYGSHYVFRYNYIEDVSRQGKHGVDAHGKTDAHSRGSRSYEIYGNTILCNGSYDMGPWAILIRGGDGVIYHNDISGPNSNEAVMLSTDYFGGQSSPWPSSAYPVDCQVRDCYIWGNTLDGEAHNHVGITSYAYNILQENRDYYLSKRSSYSSYSYPHPLRSQSEPENPHISLSPSSFEFEATSGGSNPSSKIFQISNSGEGTLDWSISDDADWLDCSPTSGSGSKNISVSVDISGLSAGSHHSTVTVSSDNADNSPQEVSVTLTLTSQPLAISASASPTSGEAPLTVNFTTSVSGGASPYSYKWDFGDEATSSDQNPSHTFSDKGDYSVTLTVTDSDNSQATDSLSITVKEAATSEASLNIASATGSPAPGDGGTTDPSPGKHNYSLGNTLQIKAIPNQGYRFAKWSGDVSDSEANSQEITITLDRNKSLTAHFFTKCGDVNGDLDISPADSQAAFDIFLGRISNPTESEKENADVNCDGTAAEPNVTPADAHAIFKKYTGKKELPCDCSCASRSASLSSEQYQPGTIHLGVDDFTASPGKEIIVPVFVDDPSLINAFGFDLLFPTDSLEFMGVERGEASKEAYNADANKIAEGVVRAGGYRNIRIQNSSQRILIKLVFRARGEEQGPISFTILNTVDDIRDVSDRKDRPRERRIDPRHVR